MIEFTRADAAACRRLVDLSLAEDLGTIGDRTSQVLIPTSALGKASIVSRSRGVLSGLPTTLLVIATANDSVTLEPLMSDGERLEPGRTIARLKGSLRTILTLERTILNFLQRLSGIATLTQKYVDETVGTKALILDTRKTIPGWRLLDKYAVRCGGGTNHRMGLFDGILIKDNHVACLGGDLHAICRAVDTVRQNPASRDLPIEVEVDTLQQLEVVLPLHPEIVLLDNFSLSDIQTAVVARDHTSPSTKLEASGGVTLSTVRDIARTGVDRISVGAITHSAPALDIALDYDAA
jgi:nicotinate-nucleotide pyrophosphorylase (carboxylating)